MTYVPSSGGGTATVETQGITWPIDTPPESLHALDDEFDGVSLDPKWTVEAYSGTPVVSVSGGLLHVQAPPVGFIAAFAGAAIDISSVAGDTNWEFTIGVAGWDSMYLAYNHAAVVFLSEGSTGAIGKTYQFAVYPATSLLYCGVNASWGAIGSDAGDEQVNGLSGGGGCYLQFKKTGSTYDTLFSTTGFRWDLIGTTSSLGFTPGRIVLGSDAENNALAATIHYKWFRKTG